MTGKGGGELGAAVGGIGALPRIRLNVFGNNCEPLGLRKSRHRCALGLSRSGFPTICGPGIIERLTRRMPGSGEVFDEVSPAALPAPDAQIVRYLCRAFPLA